MELLYLWIDNFKNIQEQGFDFSSELKFTISAPKVEGQIKHISIEVSLNDDHVNLFPKGIVNITGIVGANASGKSNLLDCIKLLSGRMSDITSGLFYCVLNHKTKTIETYYYEGGGAKGTQSLKVGVSSSKNVQEKYKLKAPLGYNIDRTQKVKTFNRIIEFENDTPVSPCCFLSNTFDSRNEDLFSGIFNISTNFRLEEFLSHFIEDQIKSNSSKKRIEQPNRYKILGEYHKKELRTLLSFIAFAKSIQTKDLPDLPDSLVIRFNFNDLTYTLDNFSKTSPLFNSIDLRKLHKKALQSIIADEDKKNKLYNLIILCSFYYALRWDIFLPNKLNPKKIANQISELANDADSNSIFKKILQFLSPLELKEHEEKTKNLQGLLGANMKRAINNITLITEPLIDNEIRFKVKIENKLWALLNRVFSFKYIEQSSFIDYQWENLSSGQEAFFLQFGRLYDIKSDILQNMFWLLIDEGDLYFHPQWQKEYVKRVIEFVQFIFPRKKVQIFLTSHSPFIASDLPRSNLIFLDRGEFNKCEVTDIESHKLTFGSNIHMLYTDSFFMDTVIGSFAQEKIDEFIKWAKDEKIKKDPSGFFGKFIKQIGEPILSAKLKEMYAHKMGQDFEVSQLMDMKGKIELRLAEINSKK